MRYATAGTANHTLVSASGASFEGMTNPGATPVGANALALAVSLGLFPVAASGLGGDGFWLGATGERLPVVGGGFARAAASGVFARHLNDPRTFVDPGVGARPAYVT